MGNTVDAEGRIIGATALELQEVVNKPGQVDPADKGIVDNADFINFMNSYLQNGVAMTENVALQNTERDEWTAGDLVFAVNKTVVINAELVEAIHSQMTVDNKDAIALTLKSTSLGIGSDVKIAEIANGVYTFSTLASTDAMTIKVMYEGVEFNNVAKALVDGINEISTESTDNLSLATGENNAVVVLNSGANVKYAGAEGINAIYVHAGAVLNVNAACDALIIADGGTIVIGENGSLTNENNVLSNVAVTNDNANEIVGTLTNTVVTANYFEWPTTTIAENSQINNVVVAPAIETVLTINQAQINKLAKLDEVTIELGANISEILSTADVTLTNVVAMTATEAVWKTNNTAGVTINGEATFTGIAEGTGVTFGSKIEAETEN